jgi:Zn-dependent metalloprotease
MNKRLADRQALAKPARSIYSAGHREELPGSIVREEGSEPAADRSANEAYDHLGTIIEFYKDVFERNSFDGTGGNITATIHYSENYCNAFWNGVQLVVGDGDGKLFGSFTSTVDIIAHELAKAVIQASSRLVYYSQSGALITSIADVLASLTKQYLTRQTVEDADWLIGAGLIKDSIALRSMSAPGTAYDSPVLGKDPQPAFMHEYVETSEDQGGVHVNSGIPNRAFYLCAMKIGGYAWGSPGKIWYQTLCNARLGEKTTFRSFATQTIAQAEKLFGPGSKEHQAVNAAWREVGVITR